MQIFFPIVSQPEPVSQFPQLRIRSMDKSALDSIAHQFATSKAHVITALLRVWEKTDLNTRRSAVENPPPGRGRGRPRKVV